VLSKERLSTTGNLIISLRQGGETGIDGLLDSDKRGRLISFGKQPK
jgi:hypothetical protein